MLFRSHPNVIGYKEAFFEDSAQTLWVIMEFASEGDLFQKVRKHSTANTHFTEKEIWHYFIQVVRGLKTLHDMKILHRDIKAANIYIASDNVVKLGDMNVSKIIKAGLAYTQTGTPYYASPEVWRDLPYDYKSDIWSLGCVLYEMCALKPPFMADSMKGLYRKIAKGEYPSIPVKYSDELITMIKMLLQINPTARPTCDQILETAGVKVHLGDTLQKLEPLLHHCGEILANSSKQICFNSATLECF